MYQVPQVTDSIYYVGVNDRTKQLFENMWSLPYGVSYNSFLVVDEVTTLIDTVDVCYSDVFFHKLETVLGERQLDYLIVNHMEPDHGGSIGLLRKRYPNVKIIGNKKTFDMLKGYHGITDGLVEVKSGDAIRVGKHEFSFLMAPMVHWPEVMFTYEQTQKVLFSADAFGTFGALNGHIFDHQADLDLYFREMHRYYSCIVGKYGSFVQKALKAMSEQNLTIDYVCPTHGVIWTPKHFPQALEIYDRLSRYEGKDGVVVLYGSMYGNTEQMADIIAQSLAEAGISQVVCHNVSKSDQSEILRDIFTYKALIVGSPTYCGGLFSPIENILNLLRVRDLKNRLYAVFGSYTWAPAAVKKLLPFAEEMGWTQIGTPVELKMADLPAVVDAAWSLGQEVAAALAADTSQADA